MSLGTPKEALLASWDERSFTTAPPEEIPAATEAEIETLRSADPYDLVESGDTGRWFPGEVEEASSTSRYTNEAGKLYIGKEFTVEEFKEWWDAQSFGSLPWTAGGVHHTYIPNERQWAGVSSLNGVFNHYRNTLGWPTGKGPHLWLYAGDGGYKPGRKLVYVGTHPASDGIGISYRNHRYLHIEAIGYYDSRPMPKSMMDLYREVIRHTSGRRVPIKDAGAGVDGSRSAIGWIFHRNAPRAGKTCPGSQVREPSFFAAMNSGTPAPVKPQPDHPGKFDVPEFTVVVVLAQEKRAEAFVAASRAVGLGERVVQWTGRRDKTEYASQVGYDSPAEKKLRTLVADAGAAEFLDERVAENKLLNKSFAETGHWNCFTESQTRRAGHAMCELKGKDGSEWERKFNALLGGPEPDPVKPPPDPSPEIPRIEFSEFSRADLRKPEVILTLDGEKKSVIRPYGVEAEPEPEVPKPVEPEPEVPKPVEPPDMGNYRKDSHEVADRYFRSLNPSWKVPYVTGDGLMIAEEAARAGLDLALCYAVAEGESAGRRVFGADYGTPGVNAIPFAHLEVTKPRVDALIKHIRTGGTSNGVSIFQATYKTFLYEADALPGGASIARNTTKVCLKLLAGHLKNYGYLGGIQRYNGYRGAGVYPYAQGIAKLHRAWKARLARQEN